MAIDEGGPAFPRTPYRFQRDVGYLEWRGGTEGMSLRDWFAGQAIAGVSQIAVSDRVKKMIVYDAYTIADEMIEARKLKENSNGS